jgi:trimethylamine:corrinoid methyltransferase-like protein
MAAQQSVGSSEAAGNDLASVMVLMQILMKKDGSDDLKRLIGREFDQVESIMSGLEAGGGTVIIGERNRVALEVMADGMQPVRVDDAALAIDAIDAVGPGGHFFGTQHTLDRFETAFHEPSVFTRQNFGQWTDGGSVDAADRATEVYQRWLREYEQPPMPDDRRAALDDFMARRIAEGGALPES